MAIRSTFVVALAIVAGLVLVATSGAAVSRAQAQEAADSVFFGYISADADGAIPLRVRATISEITCGTADVIDLEDGRGFYYIRVASDSTKTGCGVEDTPVTFLLLAGEVDPGTPAAQTQAWSVGGQHLDLSPAADAMFGAFVGELPAGAGIGAMRWTGASATPIAEALATIPRVVTSVTYLDVTTQTYRNYIPRGPASVSDYLLVDHDDIVTVRVAATE